VLGASYFRCLLRYASAAAVLAMFEAQDLPGGRLSPWRSTFPCRVDNVAIDYHVVASAAAVAQQPILPLMPAIAIAARRTDSSRPAFTRGADSCDSDGAVQRYNTCAGARNVVAALPDADFASSVEARAQKKARRRRYHVLLLAACRFQRCRACRLFHVPRAVADAFMLIAPPAA